MGLPKRQAASKVKRQNFETGGPVDQWLIESFYHFTEKGPHFSE